jgi:NAD(P)-dependent dehydrogenase (short-subunit alcohol dehydrogenase family)
VQDVREEATHATVADTALEHGPLALWVNNAGVGDDGTLAQLTSESVQRLVEINLLGTVWGMRAALGAFGVTGGDVVNVASASGLGPVPGLSMYAATKAAVVSLTTSVGLEVPKNVRIHAVCPDGVDTDMVSAMRPDGMAKALVHSGGRLLTTDEIARAVVHLVGSRRVIRSLPSWRGGLIRTGALYPSGAGAPLQAFASVGRAVIRRRG